MQEPTTLYNSNMTDLEQAQQSGIVPWRKVDDELSDFHVTVFFDQYPVTRGHRLFVPNYNTHAVLMDCFDSALQKGQRMVNDGECDGFNIGINMGESSGQTIMYPHVHLIPRRVGDTGNPIGGVRGVILGQANYKGSGYQKP